MASKTIRGITIQIGADTTALSKALSNVNKQSRDLQKELSAVDRLLKVDPKNTELLAQKQELLAAAIGNTAEKLEALRTAQSQVNDQFAKGEINEAQYRDFQREVAKTEQELDKLKKQASDTAESAKKLGIDFEAAGKKLQKAGENISSVGKKMTVGITAPVVGLGAAATKTAIDFESAFAGVRKTVDATEEQFAELERGIRDMSKEMPASASDIAAVAEAAGQLGIQTENILAFTETMIGLGEATNLSAEEAATQLARFANIVQMSQGDFDRMGSTIVALGNNFATTEGEIVALSLRLAAQGKQIGLSEAQIAALAATMSSLGVEAEAGGTAMTTALKKMQTAVATGGDDLAGFASIARMSSEEFAEAFSKDAIGALDAFVKGLAQSSAEGQNLTTVLADVGIKGIRESDTLLRMAGAADLLSGAVEQATAAWEENSALSDEVAQRYATTESQMAMLKNQVVDLAIDFGEILIPVLLDLIEAIRPLIDWFGGLSDETKKTIVVVAGIAAAIGPLLVMIGSLVSAVGTLLPLVTSLGPVLAALTGPVGLVIAAIAALVAGFVVLYKKNETFRNFVQETWAIIKDFIVETVQAIVDFVKPIIDEFKNLFGDAFKAIQEFWTKHGDTINKIVSTTFKVLLTFIKAQFEGLKLVIKSVLDWISGIIRVAMRLLQGDWSGAWEIIKETAVNIMGNVVDFLKAINLYDIGKDILLGMINGMKSMATAAVDAVKDVAGKIVGGIKGALKISSPSKVMEELGEWTGEGLAIGIKKTQSLVSAQAQELSTAAVPSVEQSTARGSAATGGGVNISFAGAIFNVRTDEDIPLIAQQLGAVIDQRSRALGGAV